MNNFLSSSDLNQHLLSNVIIEEVLSNQTEKECLEILGVFVTYADLPPFMHAQ